MNSFIISMPRLSSLNISFFALAVAVGCLAAESSALRNREGTGSSTPSNKQYQEQCEIAYTNLHEELAKLLQANGKIFVDGRAVAEITGTWKGCEDWYRENGSTCLAILKQMEKFPELRLLVVERGAASVCFSSDSHTDGRVTVTYSDDRPAIPTGNYLDLIVSGVTCHEWGRYSEDRADRWLRSLEIQGTVPCMVFSRGYREQSGYIINQVWCPSTETPAIVPHGKAKKTSRRIAFDPKTRKQYLQDGYFPCVWFVGLTADQIMALEITGVRPEWFDLPKNAERREVRGQDAFVVPNPGQESEPTGK